MGSSILQWNCRGLRTGLSYLQATIGRQRPLAISLQETKLAPDSFCTIKGYTVLRKDLPSTTEAHGGVLLAVHHSVPTRPLSLDTNIQAVAAIVQLGPTRLTVCSVYLPPGNSLPVTELRQLVLELPPPVLLLGDFNSHHTVWGCDSTDRRGRLLEAFRIIVSECLCLLNTGMRTHITLPSGQTSALDLSVASPQLVPSVSWAVDTDSMGSDHFPIWLRLSKVVQFSESARRVGTCRKLTGLSLRRTWGKPFLQSALTGPPLCRRFYISTYRGSRTVRSTHLRNTTTGPSSVVCQISAATPSWLGNELCAPSNEIVPQKT